MPRTKLIKDLDQMRTQAFAPPFGLMEILEAAEARGEAWWVIMAYGSISGDVRWVAAFPEVRESLFFAEGEQLRGRWDPERQIFIPTEGSPVNLLGNSVSLSSIEEAEEEEDQWTGSGDVRWMAALPEADESVFCTVGDQLRGLWDPGQEGFFPEDDSPLKLQDAAEVLASREGIEAEEAEWRSLGGS